MIAVATAPKTEEIAEWPRITVTVRPDGTGSLNINGTEHPCRAASLDELRTGIIARCTALAGQLHRPVRIDAAEDGRTWSLAVRPGGIVQLIDDAGTIGPADGLDVHRGPCRSCRTPQPVSAQQCQRCGASEPHTVEVVPPDGVSDGLIGIR